jgi:DNA-binding MarR family transcriptional regulator
VSVFNLSFTQGVADRLGVGINDLQCTNILDLAQGPMSAGTLAEKTGLTTGAITGVVDRLEKAGYVKREGDPNDRRRVIIRTLPKGAVDIGPLYHSIGEATERLMERYSEAELAMVVDFLAGTVEILRAEVAAFRTRERTREGAGEADRPNRRKLGR